VLSCWKNGSGGDLGCRPLDEHSRGEVRRCRTVEMAVSHRQGAQTESDPLRNPQPVKVAEKWSDVLRTLRLKSRAAPLRTCGSTTACPPGDRKHHTALNSSSDLADTQTTNECPSGVRAVRDSATHSVSAQVLLSTI